MNATWLFVTGLCLTLAVSSLVVCYLRKPLEKILVDLCGNQDRATFWTAFSAVALGFVPVIFALSDEPSSNAAGSPLLQVADQLKWGLVGMVFSVLALGWTLSRFISRSMPKK